MKPEISIIVPVYKVEAFLHKCLDSICSQTFQNLEIILIDDGSPDRSGQIRDEYAAKDQRIVVVHRENGGVSSARNVGLQVARGAYIGFVDSDDWIEPNMYEVLYTNLLRENADIAICFQDTFSSDSYIPAPENSDATYSVISGKESVREALGHTLIGFYLWNKLIKKELMNGLTFPEGKIFEEEYVLAPAMLHAKKVVVCASHLYHYRIRPESCTTSKTDPRFMDGIESYTFVYNYVASNCPELLPVANYRLLWAYFNALERTLGAKVSIDLKKKKQVIKYLRKNIATIFKCPLFSKMRKMEVIVLCVNWRLHDAIFMFLQRVKEK